MAGYMGKKKYKNLKGKTPFRGSTVDKSRTNNWFGSVINGKKLNQPQLEKELQGKGSLDIGRALQQAVAMSMMQHHDQLNESMYGQDFLSAAGTSFRPPEMQPGTIALAQLAQLAKDGT